MRALNQKLPCGGKRVRLEVTPARLAHAVVSEPFTLENAIGAHLLRCFKPCICAPLAFPGAPFG